MPHHCRCQFHNRQQNLEKISFDALNLADFLSCLHFSSLCFHFLDCEQPKECSYQSLLRISYLLRNLGHQMNRKSTEITVVLPQMLHSGHARLHFSAKQCSMRKYEEGFLRVVIFVLACHNIVKSIHGAFILLASA